MAFLLLLIVKISIDKLFQTVDLRTKFSRHIFKHFSLILQHSDLFLQSLILFLNCVQLLFQSIQHLLCFLEFSLILFHLLVFSVHFVKTHFHLGILLSHTNKLLFLIIRLFPVNICFIPVQCYFFVFVLFAYPFHTVSFFF